jgi:predicted MFS family arabinose efflux permease
MQMASMQIEQHNQHSWWMPWLVCFSASLFFFYEFIQGNMFASIADNVMHDFRIQADKMAYLSSAYYASNVIFLFFAGVVLDRMSTKKAIIIAMIMCVGSTFILANSSSFYVALACRFVTGIGSAFCFLGPIRIASRWFPSHQMAFVTGAVVTMAMSGGMLAQYPMTHLVELEGWREAVMQVGYLGLGMIFFMMIGIRDNQDNKNDNIHHDSILFSLKKAFFSMQNIKAALYTSLMNMPFAVFGAMIGTLYLMQRLGISKEEASAVNTCLFVGAILGGPLIGYISDRWHERVKPMFFGVLATLLVSAIILWVPVSVSLMMVLFFLLGVFALAQVIRYPLVAENNDPKMTATALSVISVLTQGGYVVYQNIFTSLLMLNGDMIMMKGVPVYSLADYQLAVLILPIGLIMATLMLVRLKDTR